MRRPNILLLNAHDLGRHLACYGYASVPSPALDRLAQEGVLFERSFSTAPQCSPSRAALHTGRHAHSVGVLGLSHSPFDWRLQPQHTHFAQRARDLGYATALVGMQHVTRNEDAPQLGFDHVSGVAPAADVAARAAATLQAADPAQPFYLEVGFFEPHRPYDWGGAGPYEADGVDLPSYVPYAPPVRADFAALQGAIRAMDHGVGLILRRLKSLGLEEDTLVIFTTDHGLAMPRAKCTLYDPGLETALLMRWPAAGVSGGRRLDALISHVDLVPTLLDALGRPAGLHTSAGLHTGAGLHGRSFWPLLQGESYEQRDVIFAEKSYHTAYEPQRAVRSAGHKLIVNLESGSRFDIADDIRLSPTYALMRQEIAGERPPVELYDLQRDPQERHNLAGDPAYAGIEEALRRRLWQWMEETGDPLRLGPVRSPFFERSRQWLKGI